MSFYFNQFVKVFNQPLDEKHVSIIYVVLSVELYTTFF